MTEAEAKAKVVRIRQILAEASKDDPPDPKIVELTDLFLDLIEFFAVGLAKIEGGKVA